MKSRNAIKIRQMLAQPRVPQRLSRMHNVGEDYTVWTRAEFNTMLQPLVYYVEKDDGEILYIGSSGVGLRRVLSFYSWPGVKRDTAFREAERIRILTFSTEREAREFERAEIKYHKPRYNGDPDFKPYS